LLKTLHLFCGLIFEKKKVMIAPIPIAIVASIAALSAQQHHL
jgi:hypothetical protein